MQKAMSTLIVSTFCSLLQHYTLTQLRFQGLSSSRPLERERTKRKETLGTRLHFHLTTMLWPICFLSSSPVIFEFQRLIFWQRRQRMPWPFATCCHCRPSPCADTTRAGECRTSWYNANQRTTNRFSTSCVLFGNAWRRRSAATSRPRSPR